MATHCSTLAWRITMDRGASLSIVHRVTKSQTRQKRLSMHPHTHTQSDILIFAFTFIISSRFYVYLVGFAF